MQVINRRSIHDFRVMILIVLRPESDHGPGHPFPFRRNREKLRFQARRARGGEAVGEEDGNKTEKTPVR